MSEAPPIQPIAPNLDPPPSRSETVVNKFQFAPDKPASKLKPCYYASPGIVVLAIMGKFAIRGMADKPVYHPVGVSETSREGRDAAREDIYKMIKDANPDKPSSYDLSVVPTTNLSKAFKDYLTGRVQGEKILTRTLSQVNFEGITGEQNATAEGRANAIQEAKRADKVILDYCDSSRKNVVKFEAAWQAAMHETTPIDDKLDDLAKKVRNQYRAASNKRFKLLNFYKAHPPKSDGTTLIFDKTSQPTYEHLMVDYQKSLAIFEKGTGVLDQKTDDALQVQFKKLRDRGPEK